MVKIINTLDATVARKECYMKKIIRNSVICVLVLVILTSMTLPVFATPTLEGEAHPRYIAMPCPKCGGTAKFIRHYEAVPYGNGGLITYDLYECLDCGVSIQHNVSYG